MDKEKKFVSVYQLAKAFEKMYKGLNKEQLQVFEEELLKMYPSEESTVLISSDYENEENSIGVGIYVTNPLDQDKVNPISFDKLMLEYLVRAAIAKLPALGRCIDYMERSNGVNYEVDLIPVFYDDEINEADIHFRITKVKEEEAVIA